MEFKEVQRFTQWWLWALLLGIFGSIIWSIIEKTLAGNTNFELSQINNPQWFSIVLMIIVMCFFYLFKLKTNINSHGIEVDLLIFKKKISWKEIESFEIIKYRFVGYGYRLSFKYGTVYNIKGNVGLAIKLKSGSKILIGTQKQDELQSAIQHYKQT